MARLRTLIIGGAGVALMALSLAMPTAAADTKGTLAIVNGIPGTKVDVCLNGNEIKSGLGYGGHVFKNVVGTGSKNLRFYAHDPRRCRGHQVGQESFTLDPAEDLTIVVTKSPDKVVVFGNVGLGEIPPAGTPFIGAPSAARHAADVIADLRYRWWQSEPPAPFDPAVTFGKGQWAAFNFVPGNIIQMQALRPGTQDVIASSAKVELLESRRYEWLLLGTNSVNAKFVVLDRAVSEPSP